MNDEETLRKRNCSADCLIGHAMEIGLVFIDDRWALNNFPKRERQRERRNTGEKE